MANFNNKSALGNYVHLNFNNYFQYGIGREKKENIDTALYEKARTYIKKQIEQDKLEPDTITSFESNINDLLSKSAYRKERVAIQNYLKQMIAEEIKYKIDEYKPGQSKTEKNKITQADIDEQKKRVELFKRKIHRQRNLIHEETLIAFRKKKKAILKHIKAIKKGEGLTKTKLINLNNNLIDEKEGLFTIIKNAYSESKRNENKNFIYKELVKLQRDFEKELSNLEKNTIITMKSNNNIVNILDKMDMLLEQLNIITTLSFYKGQFGEYAVALAILHFMKTEGSVSTLLKKAMTEGVKGGQRTQWQFKEEYAIGLKDSDFFETQDKVDVQYNTFEEDKESINQQIRASVKNVTESTIKIQGMDLLSLLISLNNQVKHYGTYFLNFLNSSQYKYYVGYFELIQQYAAYVALAKGNPLKEDVKAANIFVVMHVNDTMSNAKVYSTSNLLLNEMERFSFSSPMDAITKLHTEMKESYQRVGGPVNSVKDAYIRISNINNKLRTIQFKVTFHE